MYILNKKSILDCKTELEIQIHTNECQNILKNLLKFQNYDCAVIIKNFDKVNLHNAPIIKQCKLYECYSIVEYADIKNGVDIAIVEGYLTFICYGTEYELENKCYLTTVGIQVRPFDKNRNFIYLNLS